MEDASVKATEIRIGTITGKEQAYRIREDGIYEKQAEGGKAQALRFLGLHTLHGARQEWRIENVTQDNRKTNAKEARKVEQGTQKAAKCATI